MGWPHGRGGLHVGHADHRVASLRVTQEGQARRPALLHNRREGQAEPGGVVWRVRYAAASARRATSSLERMLET